MTALVVDVDLGAEAKLHEQLAPGFDREHLRVTSRPFTLSRWSDSTTSLNNEM